MSTSIFMFPSSLFRSRKEFFEVDFVQESCRICLMVRKDGPRHNESFYTSWFYDSFISIKFSTETFHQGPIAVLERYKKLNKWYDQVPRHRFILSSVKTRPPRFLFAGSKTFFDKSKACSMRFENSLLRGSDNSNR